MQPIQQSLLEIEKKKSQHGRQLSVTFNKQDDTKAVEDNDSNTDSSYIEDESVVDCPW